MFNKLCFNINAITIRNNYSTIQEKFSAWEKQPKQLAKHILQVFSTEIDIYNTELNIYLKYTTAISKLGVCAYQIHHTPTLEELFVSITQNLFLLHGNSFQ